MLKKLNYLLSNFKALISIFVEIFNYMSVFKKIKEIVLKKVDSILSNFKALISIFVAIFLVIINFNLKSLDEKEKYCHSLKAEDGEYFYFFLSCTVVLSVFNFFVMFWDHTFLINVKLFRKLLGLSRTVKIYNFIFTYKWIISKLKSSILCIWMGFMLVLHLYLIISYVIIFIRMAPLVQSCNDNNEKFNFFLIIVLYLCYIFLNIGCYVFFSFLSYQELLSV